MVPLVLKPPAAMVPLPGAEPMLRLKAPLNISVPAVNERMSALSAKVIPCPVTVAAKEKAFRVEMPAVPTPPTSGSVKVLAVRWIFFVAPRVVKSEPS